MERILITDQTVDFEFITDFCDPVNKLIFDFPETFWHNQELYIDLNKDQRLKSYGWKIFRFKSNSPSESYMEEVLKDLFIYSNNV